MPALIGLLDGAYSVPVDPLEQVVVWAADDLSTLTGNLSDIAGRPLTTGSGTWGNQATNLMAASLGPPKKVQGNVNATSRYVTSIAATQASQEVAVQFSFSSYSGMSHGAIIQSNADGSTRYDCFINGTSQKMVINRYVGGVESQIAESTLTAPDFFPINTTKTVVLRIVDNEDTTYTLSVLVDDVEICSGVDSDPIETLGRAGVRCRLNTPWYAFEHRSVITSGGTPVDTTAPVLSAATAGATGQTTASGSVTTVEANGTVYAVVTTSATQPSAAQVKAGQTHTGAAAVDADSQVVTTIGEKDFDFIGLAADTDYWVHFVHTDAAGNDSNVVSDGLHTTAALGVRSATRTAGVTTDSTSYTPAIGTREAGDTLIAFISSDEAPTLTPTNAEWESVGVMNAAGSTAKLHIFRLNRVAASSSEPAPSFTSSTAQQFAAAVYALSGPSLLNVAIAMANGVGANADLPNLNIPGGPKDCVLIAALAMDSGTITVTAGPSGYTDFVKAANGAAGGATMASAHRLATVSSENPGTFSNSSEQWAGVALAAYP